MKRLTVSMLSILLIFISSMPLFSLGAGIKAGYDSWFHNESNILNLALMADTNLATIFPINYRVDISFNIINMGPQSDSYAVMEDFFTVRHLLGFRILTSKRHTLFAGPHAGLALGLREYNNSAIFNIGIPMGAAIGYNFHLTESVTFSIDGAYTFDLLYSIFTNTFKQGTSLNAYVIYRLPHDQFDTIIKTKNNALQVKSTQSDERYWF